MVEKKLPQVEKRAQIYEGKAKKVYSTSEKDLYIIEFKDDATAFDGKKKDVIPGKGVLNNAISSHLFQYLEEKGVPTHFVAQLNEREMLVKALEIIPVEVVVRNIAAGNLSKRLGLEEGIRFEQPVLEYYYKSDALGDPMINEYHIRVLKLAKPEKVEVMKVLALRTNEILRPYLRERGLELVDFKLEFGVYGTEVLLGDEISPDTCRFWDVETHKKLDKDRFRRDLGEVVEAYEEVWRRLKGGAA